MVHVVVAVILFAAALGAGGFLIFLHRRPAPLPPAEAPKQVEADFFDKSNRICETVKGMTFSEVEKQLERDERSRDPVSDSALQRSIVEKADKIDELTRRR